MSYLELVGNFPFKHFPGRKTFRLPIFQEMSIFQAIAEFYFSPHLIPEFHPSLEIQFPDNAAFLQNPLLPT